MPPVPDEALQKIIQQIQTQLVASSRQLSMVQAQLQSHEQGKRRIELTRQQLQQESQQQNNNPKENVKFWQGVGKMFILEDEKVVQSKLLEKQKELETEISNLTKKKKFLEKQVNEAQGHMRDLFSGLEQKQRQQAA